MLAMTFRDPLEMPFAPKDVQLVARLPTSLAGEPDITQPALPSKVWTT